MGNALVFQFTPLREGRPIDAVIVKQIRISIHAPPRGATARHGFQLPRTLFQFTPLREGRHVSCGCFSGSIISIHAPPRGATRFDGMSESTEHFNSRPSARGDADAWRELVGTYHFNSRPSARGDQRREVRRSARRFQFTPLREGRLDCAERVVCRKQRFQFTPLREGRPARDVRPPDSRRISIHAPPRGATAKDMQFLQIFCSTLTNQHGLTIVPRNLSRLFW